MLDTRQLTGLQGVVAKAFDVTFTQQRTTQTQGPTGNVIDTYATVNAALSGNLAQPTGQLLQNYDYRVGDQASWLVTVAQGADLRAGDRLLTGSQTLDVQIILQPQSYSTCTQAIAAEVK